MNQNKLVGAKLIMNNLNMWRRNGLSTDPAMLQTRFQIASLRELKYARKSVISFNICRNKV